uniref:Secreted protein n=1 Tax=Anopheles darlingi TaxID=43151 RepID=A0A2M4DEG9_ANODA
MLRRMVLLFLLLLLLLLLFVLSISRRCRVRSDRTVHFASIRHADGGCRWWYGVGLCLVLLLLLVVLRMNAFGQWTGRCFAVLERAFRRCIVRFVMSTGSG